MTHMPYCRKALGVLELLLSMVVASSPPSPMPPLCFYSAHSICWAHRKVKGNNTDTAGQQVVDRLLRIPAAAAVAMAVHHHWQLVILRLGLQGQVVAALQLLALLVALQHISRTAQQLLF